MLIMLIKHMGLTYDQWHYGTAPAVLSDIARNCNHRPFQLRTHVERGLALAMVAPGALRPGRRKDVIYPICENRPEKFAADFSKPEAQIVRH